MTKILLTGASSSPGYKMALKLAKKGFMVFAIYNRNPVIIEDSNVKLFQLDLTDINRVTETVKELKPTLTIHMAAYGDVDGCEEYKEIAWKVNVESTRHLAKLGAKLGIEYFIYLSTDYVFDGLRGMYAEDDTPNPVNYYGLTKLISEEIVKTSIEKYLIIRTSAIYGLGPGRKNFGRFVVEALSEYREVKAFIDQYLSPTLNTLLADAILEFIEKGDVYGTFHVAGERSSRYEFALKIAEKFGFDKRLIIPVSIKDTSFKGRRPLDSSLRCYRAKSILRTEFHSLEYSLNLFAEEYRRESIG